MSIDIFDLGPCLKVEAGPEDAIHVPELRLPNSPDAFLSLSAAVGIGRKSFLFRHEGQTYAVYNVAVSELPREFRA